MYGRCTQKNTSATAYVRKFLDVIGPSDRAYIVSKIKNSKDMSDQDIQMQELGAEAMGNQRRN
jgi:hypothetical protein